MDRQALIQLGSKTAIGGFKNELDVMNKFNSWINNQIAQEWLQTMGYNIDEIENVNANKTKINGKADVMIEITMKDELLKHIEYISVKLVSNKNGFNQIDKRWVESYKEMWRIPDDISMILKKFTGEVPPEPGENTRDKRRVFMDELNKREHGRIIDFFTQNKELIINDLLRGKGEYQAGWVLVAIKDNIHDDENSKKWTMRATESAVQYLEKGEVRISPKGSLYIGAITMQRKGGDGGRKTANMLQFKFNPTKLINA